MNAPTSPYAGKLELYPSIDLRGGRVVRLQQGDFGREIRYDVDPLDVAARYVAAGARWLHVVDLDGAKAGRVEQADTIATIIRATSLKVQCGGGVRSAGDIDRLLGAGAARVVVGTKAVQDWPWLLELLEHDRYAGRITLAIDAREGVVATHGWQDSAGVTALEVARRTRGLPLGALLYTDVSRDGLLAGADVARTAELAGQTDVPTLASGGIGSLDDLRPLVPTAVAGVVVGRSLYEGKLDLAEAVRLGAG